MYNAYEYLIYFTAHGNLWIPVSFLREITVYEYFEGNERAKIDIFFSLDRDSIEAFISRFSTTNNGNEARFDTYVSLRMIHFPLPPPLGYEFFPRFSSEYPGSSRILSSFVCIFHGTVLRTIVVPRQPSFRPGNCFPFPRWNLALGKFEGSSEPARRWFQRCLSERFNRWNCCTVWT